MATITYETCDECGKKLPRGRESAGVMKQSGQMCANLCLGCQQSLTVADALAHMNERAAGKRARPVPEEIDKT